MDANSALIGISLGVIVLAFALYAVGGAGQGSVSPGDPGVGGVDEDGDWLGLYRVRTDKFMQYPDFYVRSFRYKLWTGGHKGRYSWYYSDVNQDVEMTKTFYHLVGNATYRMARDAVGGFAEFVFWSKLRTLSSSGSGWTDMTGHAQRDLALMMNRLSLVPNPYQEDFVNPVRVVRVFEIELGTSGVAGRPQLRSRSLQDMVRAMRLDNYDKPLWNFAQCMWRPDVGEEVIDSGDEPKDVDFFEGAKRPMQSMALAPIVLHRDIIAEMSAARVVSGRTVFTVDDAYGMSRTDAYGFNLGMCLVMSWASYDYEVKEIHHSCRWFAFTTANRKLFKGWWFFDISKLVGQHSTWIAFPPNVFSAEGVRSPTLWSPFDHREEDVYSLGLCGMSHVLRYYDAAGVSLVSQPSIDSGMEFMRLDIVGSGHVVWRLCSARSSNAQFTYVNIDWKRMIGEDPVKYQREHYANGESVRDLKDIDNDPKWTGPKPIVPLIDYRENILDRKMVVVLPKPVYTASTMPGGDKEMYVWILFIEYSCFYRVLVTPRKCPPNCAFSAYGNDWYLTGPIYGENRWMHEFYDEFVAAGFVSPAADSGWPGRMPYKMPGVRLGPPMPNPPNRPPTIPIDGDQRVDENWRPKDDLWPYYAAGYDTGWFKHRGWFAAFDSAKAYPPPV